MGHQKEMRVSKPDLSHPLCGADLKTLSAVTLRSGGVKPSRILNLAFAFVAALGRFPFTAAEYSYVALKRPKTEPLAPPVFILGHWRSGTTHLYNIMSRAERFGYVSPFATALPWDILSIGGLFGKLLEKSLPEGRYIDNVPVHSDSPQEDEIALANMTRISYYHALYFPEKFETYFNEGVFFDGLSPRQIKRWEKTLRYLYLKLTLDQDGRQLLIKNPVYTARAAHLRTLYPDAKFIHIHRSPYKVFVSMQNFYKKLFAQFALQDYAHVDIDAVIFKTYRRMMDAVQTDIADMAPGQCVELSFDDLQADPMAELGRIYDQLELGAFETDAPIFRSYLDSIAGYEKNKFGFSPDLARRIEAEWGDLIKAQGYRAPK